MTTPILDFVRAYAKKGGMRLHMPGHKGKGVLGIEWADITEIEGADVLYRAEGIIAESERNAASLFGSRKTFYSTEGSSLSIRAMLYLTALYARSMKKRPLIWAGRNAHKALLCAAAQLDIDLEFLIGDSCTLLSCPIDARLLEKRLAASAEKPIALYVTSPDYLGNTVDIAALAEVAHRYGVLLLVDNAHGAYLRFLSPSAHPISLGADLACDSAHKTLPALTGASYLHIGQNAPTFFDDEAENAFSFFASSSPSYLILQSLDALNLYLDHGYREKLAEFALCVAQSKKNLAEHGYRLVGDEPLKLTLAPKSYGYTGKELASLLSAQGITLEFADPDYAVMMLTPELGTRALLEIEYLLMSIERRTPILEAAPPLPRLSRVMSAREALLSQGETVPCEKACGRILSDAVLSCPPAIPIAVCGERLNEEALRLFAYYGMEKCRVLCE